MICLDSTFFIDVLRREKSAVSKLKELSPGRFVTTMVNAAEFLLWLYGAKNLQQSQIVTAKELLERIPVLQLDLNAITAASEIKRGLLKAGTPTGNNDLLIAGIMLHNGCSTILTRDVKDFERISGIRVITY